MDAEPHHRTLLALIVEMSGNTQVEVAEQFTRLGKGEKATLSERTLRRWMTGDIRKSPHAAQRRTALALWGFPIEELLSPPTLGAVAALRTRRMIRDFTSDDCSQGTNDWSKLERGVTMAAERAAGFTAGAEGSGVGPETLDQLSDDVRAHASAYLSDPVASLLMPLAQTQDKIFAHLEARQRPARAVDLYLLAGVTSALLAKLSQDLGRPREAMAQARAAFVCADNAGHAGLRAWARGLQSLIAYWYDRPSEAARFAHLGAAELGTGRGSVAAWLPALEARAWALAGDGEATAAAITRAERAREACEPDDLDEIGGLFTFVRAKQHYYAAGALVQLPNTAANAEQEAGTALELYTSGAAQQSYSDIAGAHAELALARVLASELDGATEALQPVLELPVERRIVGIVESAGRVHNALRTPAITAAPLAGDLRAAIEAFTRLPAAEL